MTLKKENYYLQLLIQDTVDLVRLPAVQKGLSLNVSLDDSLPHQLQGDPKRIRQILMNLLNNSIKFTQKGSISLEITGAVISPDIVEIKFIVTDTGIGIKEKDMSKIFGVFQQVDMNRNRAVEGIGLGLAISKHLLKLMNGDITVKSKEGEGSTFTATLQQQIVNAETIAANPVTHKILEPPTTEMFTCKSIRALVVDDNVVNRKIACHLLNGYGMQITDADSGVAAVELVKSNAYDLIFMDHMMPEMDGIEAVRHIRYDCGENGWLPVIIALTANVTNSSRDVYLNNGFQDFLGKPFDKSQLHEIICKWVPEDKRSYTGLSIEEQTNDISSIELLSQFLPDINVMLAAGRNGGITEYMELLDLFYMDGNRKIPLLKRLIDEADIDNYRIEVHGLKSAAANIGAEKLSELAKRHEQAAKENDTAFINTHCNELLNSYQLHLDEIMEALKRKNYGSVAKSQTEASAHRNLEHEDLVRLLTTALNQIESFKSKECLNTVNEILEYSLPDDIKNTLIQVNNMLKLYEDDDAEDTLRQLVQSMNGDE